MTTVDDIGLNHNALTQLFHHRTSIFNRATKTAVLFGKGNDNQPSSANIVQNSRLMPSSDSIILRLVSKSYSSRTKRADAVFNHYLFFGKLKIHLTHLQQYFVKPLPAL